jgi:hypothetical protein
MGMVLSTTPSSAPVESRVNARRNVRQDARPTHWEADLCALVCAASAGVHGALVAPHAAESNRMAAAFALATVALAVAALEMALAPRPEVSAVVAALLLLVAVAYVLSRTSGIPGLTEHPESFDTLGAGTSVLEVAAAMVAVRHLNRRRSR